MNNKSQELSLNVVVIGGLALLVLLIVGGLVMFGGSDIIDNINLFKPSDESVYLTAFRNSCETKCSNLQLLGPSTSGVITENEMIQLKNYCCESSDLDSNAKIELSTALGPEICSLAKSDCRVSNRIAAQFCIGSYNKVTQSNVIIGQSSTVEVEYDFTKTINYESGTTFDIVETCNI